MKGIESGTCCSFDGCSRESKRGGYCWGHVKQKQRHGRVRELDPPKQKGGELRSLIESVLSYADAEDDIDYERAYDSLRKAAQRYTCVATGRIGAAVRAKRLSPARRSEIALLAARKRWTKCLGLSIPESL